MPGLAPGPAMGLCMPSRPSGFLARYQTLLLVLLIVAGVLVRLGWLYTNKTPHSLGEAQNAAVAFSQTGVIADAFRPGQGPTAHVMPVTPAIAGLVYRQFGVDSAVSAGILTAWSLALVFGGYLLFFRAFGRVGTPLPARLGAFAVLALIPLNVSLEAAWFRVWDGALAVFMAAFCLNQVLRLDAADRVGRRDVIGLGLLAAACLFVSPAIGLAAYGAGLVLMVRKTAPRRWPGITAVVAVTAAIVLTPWLVRNNEVMGKPILLRDNFGLELSLGFHADAASTSDMHASFVKRLRTVHPFGDGSGRAYAALQAAGGEIAYAEKMGAEAKAWIRDNPGASVRLAFVHLRGMLFPPAWYWDMFGKTSTGTLVKMAANWLLTVLALAGLGLGLWRATRPYVYVALFALLPLTPYILVQPILRYRYLITALFTFIAADFIARVWARLGRRPAGAA